MGSARLWGFGYCRPGFSAALRAPQVTLRDRTRFSCYLGGMGCCLIINWLYRIRGFKFSVGRMVFFDLA